MKTFDVAIAGAGLIGSAIALELVRAGLRVALFDRDEPGREASWAGAGMLSPAPENPGMIPLVPLGKASLKLYPEFVTLVEELSGKNVGFRAKGAMEVLFSRDAARELSTLIALHHGLGLPAEPLSAEDARGLEPALSEEIEAAVLRPEEGAVDNRLLMAALLDAVKRNSVEIFAGAPVQEIWKIGEKCFGLIVEREKIAAKWTIVAAGSFSAQIAGVEPYAPVCAAKGQMVALRSSEIKVERALWSQSSYVVPRNDGRILAGSTIEHVGFNKTVTAGGLKKVLQGATELVPGLANARIEETWAGLRPDTPDHLPILGPTDVEGLLMATGHFRSGILLTPITAKLIGEWVLGKSVSVECERFSPMRFMETSGKKEGMPQSHSGTE